MLPQRRMAPPCGPGNTSFEKLPLPLKIANTGKKSRRLGDREAISIERQLDPNDRHDQQAGPDGIGLSRLR